MANQKTPPKEFFQKLESIRIQNGHSLESGTLVGSDLDQKFEDEKLKNINWNNWYSTFFYSADDDFANNNARKIAPPDTISNHLLDMNFFGQFITLNQMDLQRNESLSSKNIEYTRVDFDNQNFQYVPSLSSHLRGMNVSENTKIAFTPLPKDSYLSTESMIENKKPLILRSDVQGLSTFFGGETRQNSSDEVEVKNIDSSAVWRNPLTFTINPSVNTKEVFISILLDIPTSFADPDGSGSALIMLSGFPPGSLLSAGTSNGNGSWSLSLSQLTGLSVSIPQSAYRDFSFTVTSTFIDGHGSPQSLDAEIDVEVGGGGYAYEYSPKLTVEDASGNGSGAIPLSIDFSLVNPTGGETTSVVISNVPVGFTLSAGVNQGGGVWTLDVADLPGLTITPALGFSGNFILNVSGTVTDSDGDVRESVGAIDLEVIGVADPPNLSVNDVAGNEDTAIPLTISASLVDTDGSETLSIVISGMPAGASLSAGTDNANGSWTLTPAQLVGLTLMSPAHSNVDFQLTVTAISTEGGGGTAQTVDTINVDLTGIADAPNLSVTSNVSGNEDAAIPLTITSSLVDTDGSETLSIVISGMPAGASLSAGTDNANGSWTLTPGQLAGLTLTPPAHSNVDFQLTVTAISTESGGGSAQTVRTIDVDLTAVADAPNLTANNATGNEDTAIPLTITSSLVDTDGSETLTSIVISGMPAGASLSAGIDNGDGSWTLTPGQLAGLTLTPPTHSNVDFQLTVTATSTDAGGVTAQTIRTLDVNVVGVGDAPNLSVTNNVSGNEDTVIPLTISSSLVDTDGSETLSIVISGMPAGASLSAGTDNGNGSWTLTPGQLVGLTLTPPAHSNVDFQLTVTAVSTENDGDTEQTIATIDVNLTGVADAPNLSVTANVSGNEDTAIPLTISSSLGADTDGSETLSIVISGMPAGASLSAGTNNGNGSWTLTAAQLVGLTLTPPAHSNVDFQLTVTAVTTENDGDTEQTVGTIDVNLTGVADTPSLTVSDAGGNVNSPIELDISSALIDTDGSETLTIQISGVPVGATLSAGTNLGGGVWSLTSANLVGLTITPPVNSDAEFQLTVLARSTENDGSTTTISDVIDVNVGYPITAVEFIRTTPIVAAQSFGTITTAGNQNVPGVLGLSNGNYVIVHGVSVSGPYIVVYNSAGQAITGEVSATGSGSTRSDMVELANGNFVVVGLNSSEEVMGQIFNSSGAKVGGLLTLVPSAAVQTNVPDTLHITALQNGGFAVSWITIPDLVQMRMFNSSGTATSAITTLSVSASNAGNDIATLKDGRFIVSWCDLTATPDQVLYKIYNQDGTVSVNTTTAVTVTSGTAADNTVTALEEGGFVLTWRQGVSVHYAVFGVDGSVVRADTTIPGGSFKSAGRVTALLDGGFIITWVDSVSGDPNLSNIKAQRYSSAGTTVGSQITVNSVLTGTQDSPEIARLSNGNVIVVWGDDSGGTIDAVQSILDFTSTLIVPASATPGTVLGTIYSVDADTTDSYTYTMVSGDQNLFELFNGNSIRVAAGATFDANVKSSHDLQVKVEDSQGNVFIKSFTFTVQPGANAPTDLTVSNLINVSAATVAGTVVANLGATDPNVGDTFTYSIADGDNSLFQITGSNLVVKAGATFNYFISDTHDVEIKVTDASGNVYTEVVTVSVTNPGASGGTVVGTDSANVLTSNTAAASVYAYAGNDTVTVTGGYATIFGMAGDDLITGGSLADVVYGGSGTDTVYGGGGDDTIRGGEDNDFLYGGADNDTIYGGVGNDVIYGQGGNDTVYGNEGSDVFMVSSGGGTDTVTGGTQTGDFDAIHLEDVSGGPSGGLGGAGTWIISGDSYTITGNILTFDAVDAQGTITYWDGTTVNFDEIEQISW